MTTQMTNTDGLSNMMKHYLETKNNYQDCILLYRLGDFYEMFFEDAEVASEILDLVLTSRNAGNGRKAPMCGVPYHAVENYISKLISAGKKVAICEQLTEPQKGVKLVERDVVRVITAGTVVENNILEAKSNNYIAFVFASELQMGIAICDISTGYFATTEFDLYSMNSKLQEFLISFAPSEILANSKGLLYNDSLECFLSGELPKMQNYDGNFALEKCTELLKNQYSVNSLESFGLAEKNSAVIASGALLEYLLSTQKRSLPHLNAIKLLESNDFLSIDAKSRKNLEITANQKDNKKSGSLLWILDKTKTNMGARLLSDYVTHPLQNRKDIEKRLDGIEELTKSAYQREALAENLKKICDLERITSKIAYNSAMPKDLDTLKKTLKVLPQLTEILGSLKSGVFEECNNLICDLDEVYQLLDHAILEDTAEKPLPATLKDGGFIKAGVNGELDELIDLTENGNEKIKQLLEQERDRTGIKSLKLGFNKVFGYYFEVSNSFKESLPSDFIRRQTIANGERFVTERLKELEDMVLTSGEKRQRLEKLIYENVRMKLLVNLQEIQNTAKGVAIADVILSLANVAVKNKYIKPIINDNTTLKITNGRHAVVEAYVKRENFITNDTLLDTAENRTMVITGPNMAGKSTYMRQVALIVLMAHIGSFVPADYAEIPVVDKIFTRVGASDDLAFNQSTFMVEMVEVANILNNATQKSLVILDEVGRGTSTFDGLSIAWAIMEYVSQNIGAKTLFATHFHELTELEGQVEGVKNYRVTVKEQADGIIFLHKIERGGANKSFGIEVAQLAGVPSVVCNRAKEIVKTLEEKK